MTRGPDECLLHPTQMEAARTAAVVAAVEAAAQSAAVVEAVEPVAAVAEAVEAARE